MPKPVEPRHSAEEIDEAFRLDPKTGWVYRRRNNTIIMGAVTMLEGHTYQVCRIAWCLHHGEWPPLDRYIDHKNGKHHDDRPENLRLATSSQNNFNSDRRGRYARGVRYDPRNSDRPWSSRIRFEGVEYHLGNFYTESEAAAAFLAKAEEFHGEFAFHNRKGV
jgi:hypothetical protein